jgi:hypothetical protein
MPHERIRGFFIFILIGIVIIYIIYRSYNKFTKKDIPFKASAEINLIGLLVGLALFLIYFLLRD